MQPSLAGPRRPQDRVTLGDAKTSFHKALQEMLAVPPGRRPSRGHRPRQPRPTRSCSRAPGNGQEDHGRGGRAPTPRATGTSAGATAPRLGRDRRDHQLHQHVESLGDAGRRPAGEEGRRARALDQALGQGEPGAGVEGRDRLPAGRPGVDTDLDALRFNLVGYGCTTCIGNSGPLPAAISEAIQENDLVAVAVLSGNRNFEGRINPDVRANYLASPPLVVAYALAGTMDIDLATEPIGIDREGQPVYLKDIWPSQKRSRKRFSNPFSTEMFRSEYGEVFEGDEQWSTLPVPQGDLYGWDETSTYVKNPPYFVGMPAEPAPVAPITRARVLAVLGDSITTDHISPAGLDQAGRSRRAAT